MVLKGPFLNGARLPVNQILLLGCWYLPITLTLAFLRSDSFASQSFCKCRRQTQTYGLQLWMPSPCLLSVLCTLSCIARARLRNCGGYVLNNSYDLFLPLHQSLF